MLVVQAVCHRNELLVPAIIAGLHSADQKDRDSARFERSNSSVNSTLRKTTALPYHARHVLIYRDALFSRAVLRYLTDDEYGTLQEYLNSNPEAGAVVPGSGGVRKLRWRLAGGGKRSGLRIIYYLLQEHGQIWMLTLYGKNVRENIPAHLLRQMKKAIDDGKDD